MWDSELKLGKSLSLPLFLAGGQRKEGPALHGLPWCDLPQLSVRLSPAQPLASVWHLTCFLLPQLPCSLHGGGGEGGDWSGLSGGEPPPAQGCSSQLEGRPRVWRTPGPFREAELFPCQSSAGLGWALRLTVAGLRPLPAAWHSAEVRRGQGRSRGSQEGAVEQGNSGPGLTSPLTRGTPLPSLSLCPHGGGRESPVPAIHCVARTAGSVVLTLSGSRVDS